MGECYEEMRRWEEEIGRGDIEGEGETGGKRDSERGRRAGGDRKQGRQTAESGEERDKE